MTDQELLLSLSDMMDKKFHSELQPIKDDLQFLKNNVQVLKDDVQVLKNEVQVLKDDVQVLKIEVQVLKDDVQVLKNEVQVLKDDVQVLKIEVQVLKDDIHKINLYQENVIMPRLNTIESCYLDTYNRYKKNADRMESVYNDVELLKKVVSEHSVMLQQLA